MFFFQIYILVYFAYIYLLRTYYITVYLCINLYTFIYLHILYRILIITFFRGLAGSLRPSLPIHPQGEPQAALQPYER